MRDPFRVSLSHLMIFIGILAVCFAVWFAEPLTFWLTVLYFVLLWLTLLLLVRPFHDTRPRWVTVLLWIAVATVSVGLLSLGLR